MHKWLLTVNTVIFTVDEHDQSAENSLSCPLNTETGTDTHIPPSKWVIKPHQLTHVYQCKLNASDVIQLSDLFQPIDLYNRLSRGPEEISYNVSSDLAHIGYHVQGNVQAIAK